MTQRSLRISLGISAGIGLTALATGVAPLTAATRSVPPGSRPARRGGASPAQATQQMGGFRFGANEISGESLSTGGVRLLLTGKAWLSGQGRTITAQEMSIDVPKGASDISVGRASGNVRMTMTQQGGRKLAARGNSLIYNRGAGKIDLAGAVRVQSDLVGGGSMTATGGSAEVLIDSNSATLNGGVRLTLVKPDTLNGPATLTGANMTVDLDTGKWKIFGGQTNGSFNLKPQAGKS